jgi:plastocyanin
MNRPRSFPVLIAGLALALAACGGTAPSPAASEPAEEPSEPSQVASAAPSEAAEPSEAAGEEATVRLSQFAFDPEELTIAVGTEVSFVNADAAAHTVTEGTDGVAADDPIIDEELTQNAATSFTFDEAGTYEITCLFHPSMNMTIVVE